MQQVYEMKVIVLTRGDLTNMLWECKSEPTTCTAMYGWMVRSQQKP